jgi:hypothetical protein
MKKIINKFFHFSLFKLYSKLKGKAEKTESYNPLTLKRGIKGWSEKYNLILLHNPKVAGTSLMEILEIPMFYNHHYPLRRFSVEDWEKDRFLLVVRHPLDRLVSAYYYHTGSVYSGGYLKLFPNLKNMSFYEYFKYFCGIEHTITPQYNYTYRPGSDKKVDFILKFENLAEDLKSQLGIDMNLPKKNQTIRDRKPSLSQKEINIINVYYNLDFEMFDYSPDDFYRFIEVHN